MHNRNNINLPIIGHSLHLSDNVDELHSKITQYIFDIEIIKIKPSRFKFDSYLAFKDSADISISSVRYGLDTKVDFLHDNCLTLVIILDGVHATSHNKYNNEICDHVFFIPPKADVSADISGNCSNLIVRFKPTQINLSIFKNFINGSSYLTPTIQDLIKMAGQDYLDTYYHISSTSDDHELITNFKNSIYDIILNHENLEEKLWLNNKSLSDDMINFFKGNPDWRYNISELVEIYGIAERTLYWQFKKETGATPYRCYINIKLMRTRLDLMKYGNAKTITDIASENGFLHLSRFSNQYKILFGELPNQTVNRLLKQGRFDLIFKA